MKSALSRRFDRMLAWPLLCLFVFSIPWVKSLAVGELGTFTRLVGLLALATVGLAALLDRSFRPPNLALIAAAAFAAWTALSWRWSIVPAETADRAFTFAQLLAMLWMIWQACRSSRRLSGLMQAYVAGAAVASVLTLTRYARGLETYYRRYAAPGFDPNDLGLTVALAIPLALYLALHERGPLRWAYHAAVVLAIAAILLSASRTSLLISILAFAFVLATWRASDWPHRLASILLFGLLISGALYLAPEFSRQRLATLPVEATQGTLHNRTQIWKAGLRVFRTHPLLGIGAGGFPEAVRPQLGVPPREGHRYVAHNSYLSILVECGIVGLGLFTLFLAILAAYTWFLPATERALWCVVLAGWALGITTLTWEFRKPGWLFFGLIMAGWARAFLAPKEAR